MDNPLGTSLGKSATQVTYAKPQRVKSKQSADVQVRSAPRLQRQEDAPRAQGGLHFS